MRYIGRIFQWKFMVVYQSVFILSQLSSVVYEVAQLFLLQTVGNELTCLLSRDQHQQK